jgi:hypothetical protein
MKNPIIALRLFAVLAATALIAPLSAHEGGKVAGPNGGRIITTVEPRAEFFVLPDRKVQITFLDKAGKPIAPASQTVTVTSGERASPVTLTFTKSGQTLVSNVAVPPGDSVPTVVQIKPAPNAATVTERFHVDLSKCGECKLSEYACICGH